jgi:hypothetical protein
MKLHVAMPGGLDAARTKAKAEIDAAAGVARSRYITTVPGQAETYLAKAAEARAYINAGEPSDLATWSWIAAEVRATGNSPGGAAGSILANEANWTALGTAIEEIRLTAKRAVDAAQIPRECFRIAHDATGQLEDV